MAPLAMASSVRMLPLRPAIAPRARGAAAGARAPVQAGAMRVVRVRAQEGPQHPERKLAVASVAGALSVASVPGAALATAAEPMEAAYGELAALGLDLGVQALYLSALLALLATGTFLVVRQILVRRELEETAKDVGERVRAGKATGEEYFELGVVLLRKKSYTQAVKNLERALAAWDGEPEEKAQAFNALGYALFMQEKHEKAAENYLQAVELQPGYVTAWNNLGNAYEKLRKPELALEAYQETLSYAPDNEIAKQRASMLGNRLNRLKGGGL